METDTEVIYRAYLTYASYMGWSSQVTDEGLESMMRDLKALCAEYGVETS